MTAEELDIVRGAFEGALKVGAPGLHEPARNAVMVTAMVRIRHQLKIEPSEPAPLHDGHLLASMAGSTFKSTE